MNIHDILSRSLVIYLTARHGHDGSVVHLVGLLHLHVAVVAVGAVGDSLAGDAAH